MNKTTITLFIPLFIGVMVGCGVNNDPTENQNVQPIGFYTNEKDENNQRYLGMGKNIDLEFSRGLRNEQNNRNVRDIQNNNQNVNFRRDDYNYHGQMNTSINSWPTESYGTQRDAQFAKRISQRVSRIDGVDDARAVISGNEIVIMAYTSQQNDGFIKRKIKNVIHRMGNIENISIKLYHRE